MGQSGQNQKIPIFFNIVVHGPPFLVWMRLLPAFFGEEMSKSGLICLTWPRGPPGAYMKGLPPSDFCKRPPLFGYKYIPPSSSFPLPWLTVMGNLAKAAVVVAKLNLLILALSLVLGITTLILAGLSVRLDNEPPVLYLWPSALRSTVDKRTVIEGAGITLEDVLPEWVPRTRRQKHTA